MAVEVNWTRLKATHRELGGEGTLIVQLLPEAPTTAEVLDSALVDDPYPVDEGPFNGGWFAGPKGWLLLLETEVDQTLWDWIGLLAERLSRAGLDGTLTGVSHAGRVAWARALEDGTDVGAISPAALVAFQPLPSDTIYNAGWGAEPEVLDQVLDHFLPWVLADTELARVRMGGVSIGVPPGHARDLVRSRILNHHTGLLTGYSRATARISHLWFNSPAAVSVQRARRDPRPWQDIVAELRDLILTAPRGTLTLARIDFNPWHSLTSTSNTDLGHDPHAFWLYPDLWGEWSPEPCPIQILTDTHLAKAHDLTDWTVTRLDSTHALVEATDLTPWFTTRSPRGYYHFPPDLIAQARHDFGDMILTPDQAHDLGLTSRPLHR